MACTMVVRPGRADAPCWRSSREERPGQRQLQARCNVTTRMPSDELASKLADAVPGVKGSVDTICARTSNAIFAACWTAPSNAWNSSPVKSSTSSVKVLERTRAKLVRAGGESRGAGRSRRLTPRRGNVAAGAARAYGSCPSPPFYTRAQSRARSAGRHLRGASVRWPARPRRSSASRKPPIRRKAASACAPRFVNPASRCPTAGSRSTWPRPTCRSRATATTWPSRSRY